MNIVTSFTRREGRILVEALELLHDREWVRPDRQEEIEPVLAHISMLLSDMTKAER